MQGVNQAPERKSKIKKAGIIIDYASPLTNVKFSAYPIIPGVVLVCIPGCFLSPLTEKRAGVKTDFLLTVIPVF